MKPVRGLPNLWPGSLPPERRLALVASALLFLLIGGMAFYQFRMAPAPGGPEPAPGAGAEPVPGEPAAAGTQASTGALTGSDAAAAAGTEAPVAGAPAETGVAAADDVEAVPAFSWPLSGAPVVVKAFGSLDQSLGDYRLYDAVALEATPGQPVVAAAAGRVVAVEEHPVDGTTVLLEHAAGRQTRYAGLAEVTVAEGDAVSAGETIGQVGRPGPLRRNLGPHLAFSLLIEGEPVDPELHIDP
ncbi:peptidoglycan DD-metalloendopeptidase family protein [Symbiobacterium terraclitae]|uniref:peptidoglycan DD-metalloendopeptidase family protein n=1 Tax=Symbiobacterium terraclitae TaxID=557451 RepID=UPI0035B535C8